MNQIDWKAYFKPDEICLEIRNKHAKLNELNEAQSDVANSAIREAFEAAFATGFVSGLTEGKKASATNMAKVLAVRTFFSVVCALPVVSALLVKTANVAVAFVGAAVLLTIWFYLWDTFFYGIPKIVAMFSDLAQKFRAAKQKKKDELPR